MIDFSTLKGLTIPEGNVKQIADAQGNVLWSAAKPVTITLKRKSGMYNNPEKPHGWIVVNGQTYYAEETPTEIPVKTGTTITCCKTAGVQVNGQYVSQGADDYEYTVSSNAIIEIVSTHVSDTQYLGLIVITEIPEGHALVTITGTGDADYSHVTIDGVKYTGAATVAVPIGTTIYCYVRSKNDGYADIMLPNNEHIYAETKVGSYYYAEYNYAVSGNVQIGLSYSSMITTGGIVITET